MATSFPLPSVSRKHKDGLRTALARILIRLVAPLPLWAAHGIGAAAGWLLWLMPNELRRITRLNLALCLGDKSPGVRRYVERRSLIETGKAALEVAAVWTWSRERLLGQIREINGEGYLEQAMASGKGVIINMPHLGAWEVLSLYLSDRYPLTTMFRPLRVSGMNDTVKQARQRFGARLVPTDTRGVRAVRKALDEGEMVAILADQEPSLGNGVFAPFFGVPAKTGVLLPRLVNASGATVICAFAERLPWGRGYRLQFTRARDVAVPADLEETAQRLNYCAEQQIRRAAGQYLWSYKRFRSRPAGTAKVY